MATEPMIAETGASWKASVPMTLVGTCPQITTIGMESASESRIGVTVLVAPGPEVTMQTPDPATGAGVTHRHEAGTLLIGRYDQRQRRCAIFIAVFIVIAEHSVIGGQDCATAVAEYRLHALIDKYLDDDLGVVVLAGKRVWSGFGGLGACCHKVVFSVMIAAQQERCSGYSAALK